MTSIITVLYPTCHGAPVIIVFRTQRGDSGGNRGYIVARKSDGSDPATISPERPAHDPISLGLQAFSDALDLEA